MANRSIGMNIARSNIYPNFLTTLASICIIYLIIYITFIMSDTKYFEKVLNSYKPKAGYENIEEYSYKSLLNVLNYDDPNELLIIISLRDFCKVYYTKYVEDVIGPHTKNKCYEKAYDDLHKLLSKIDKYKSIKEFDDNRANDFNNIEEIVRDYKTCKRFSGESLSKISEPSGESLSKSESKSESKSSGESLSKISEHSCKSESKSPSEKVMSTQPKKKSFGEIIKNNRIAFVVGLIFMIILVIEIVFIAINAILCAIVISKYGKSFEWYEYLLIFVPVFGTIYYARLLF